MIDFNSNITSSTKPLINFLKSQQENRKFVETIELGATVFLIAFFLLFAIRPTVLVISSLIGEINSKKILTANLKNKINNVIQAQDSFAQVQERYLVIDSSLPSSEKYAAAANQMISAATATGMSLDSLNFVLDSDKQPGRKDIKLANKNLKEFEIVSSTYADFPTILQYLDRLTNNRRHFEVPSISISSLSDNHTQGQPDLDPNKSGFRISVNTFYWQE